MLKWWHVYDKEHTWSLLDDKHCWLVCNQKCHVTEQEVHNALLSGDQQDQLVIAYHLVLDNNRIADEADKLQIHDFFVASSPPVESFMLVSCFSAVLFLLHLPSVYLLNLCWEWKEDPLLEQDFTSLMSFS